VLLAQALMPQPSLLVLDEPFNNIDQQGEETMLALIDSLSKQGMTLLWVAHDLEQVRKMADKLSCINRGVVYSGPPADFLDSLEAAELFHLATGKPMAARKAAP